MGLIICLMGFFGGLVMSAIKRDYGVKDWGNMIQGHGGMLDRVDSVCFAAPRLLPHRALLLDLKTRRPSESTFSDGLI